jgi:hypothetical protein
VISGLARRLAARGTYKPAVEDVLEVATVLDRA